MKSKPNIRLSTEAMAGLHECARSDSYSTISPWLKACAVQAIEFIDARPEYAKVYDDTHFPRPWHTGEVKQVQKLGALPAPYLLSIASQYSILPFQLQRASVRDTGRIVPIDSVARLVRYSVLSRIAPVVEAIGIGWLVQGSPLATDRNTVIRRTRFHMGEILIGTGP